MLSLETIMKDTMWVAKMTYGRFVGTYDEVGKYFDSNECRDFDLVAQQPEHLQEFYDGYYKYCDVHGWTTIPKYYKIITQ